MPNDTLGLYINKGNGMQIQNSGVCKKQGDRSECEIYAHTGSGWTKIYPRQQDYNIPNGSNGGIGLSTVRSGYSSWKTGRAMQGYYSGNEGRPLQSIGHIFWNNGKPTFPGTLVGISRVRLSIIRNINTGSYNSTVTGYLRMSNLRNSGTWNQCIGTVQSSPQFTFTWGVGGTTTTIDNNANLNDFMYKFFTNGTYQSLCLYTGETGANVSYGGGNWSRNYAGTSSVSIEIWAQYQT